MRKLFTKAWFRWLLAGSISGIFVLWLGLSGGLNNPGGYGWFR